MGYSLQPDLASRNRTPASSFRTPKTLTPGPRLQQRGLRYYSAELGRWTRRDPIGERGGDNVYAFVRNSSVNLTDALGLEGTNDASAGKTCPCCCCVSWLALSEIVKYQQPTYVGILFGHKFTAEAKLQYVLHTEQKDCTLEWWEKDINNPPKELRDKGAKANEWYDAYKLVGETSPTFGQWNRRTCPCPGAEPVNMPDAPASFLENPGRSLYIAITIKSAEGCPCQIRSITVYFTQHLDAKVTPIVQDGYPGIDPGMGLPP